MKQKWKTPYVCYKLMIEFLQVTGLVKRVESCLAIALAPLSLRVR